MSTKIYDAYKLNIEPNPSYNSVCRMMDKLRAIAHDTAKKQFVEQMFRTAVFAMDIKNIIGEKKVDEIIEKADAKAKNCDNKDDRMYWRSRSDLFKSVKKAERINKISLFRLVDTVAASWENQEQLFPMTASICVFPHNEDVLAMLFGNRGVLNALDGSEYLLDYHYQNQTDKPDDISDGEWDKREKDWDETIGPDYIPIRHGMKVDLVDIDRLEVSILFRERAKIFEIKGLELPDLKSRISYVAKYMDCPVQKTDRMSITEFANVYNEWKDSLHLENQLSEITLDDLKPQKGKE